MIRQSISIRIYAVLVMIIVLMAVLQSLLPIKINPGQAMSLPMIAVAITLGAVGMYLAPKCGFADMLDERVPNTQRFGIPFATGAALGLLIVVLDRVAPMSADIQTRFPDSVIVFVQAGLVEEILIHLFLISLLYWLFSVKLLKRRYPEIVFWSVSIGAALAYWLFQMNAVMTYFPQKFSMLFAVQTFVIISVTITLGAYYFRTYGFLAAVSLRYGFYLVWHILWAGGIGAVRYLST